MICSSTVIKIYHDESAKYIRGAGKVPERVVKIGCRIYWDLMLDTGFLFADLVVTRRRWLKY
jgi:hypothetical protein